MTQDRDKTPDNAPAIGGGQSVPAQLVNLRRWFEHIQCEVPEIVNNRLFQLAIADVTKAGAELAELREDVDRLDSLVADAGEFIADITDQLHKQAQVIAQVGLQHNALLRRLDLAAEVERDARERNGGDNAAT